MRSEGIGFQPFISLSLSLSLIYIYIYIYIYIWINQLHFSVEESLSNCKGGIKIATYLYFAICIAAVGCTSHMCVGVIKEEVLLWVTKHPAAQMFTHQSKKHKKVHGPLVSQTVCFHLCHISGSREYMFWKRKNILNPNPFLFVLTWQQKLALKFSECLKSFENYFEYFLLVILKTLSRHTSPSVLTHRYQLPKCAHFFFSIKTDALFPEKCMTIRKKVVKIPGSLPITRWKTHLPSKFLGTKRIQYNNLFGRGKNIVQHFIAKCLLIWSSYKGGLKNG